MSDRTRLTGRLHSPSVFCAGHDEQIFSDRDCALRGARCGMCNAFDDAYAARSGTIDGRFSGYASRGVELGTAARAGYMALRDAYQCDGIAQHRYQCGTGSN